MTISQREIEFLLKFKADAAQAVNTVRTQLQGIASSAKQMNQSMAAAGQQAAQAMQSAAASSRRAHSGIHGLVGGIHQLRGVLVTLGIAKFASDLTDVATATDRLNAKMKFTFQTTSEVNKQMEFTHKLSNDLGISFKGTTDQFASFAAASQASGLSTKTLQDIFVGFSEAGTALQLTGEQMNGAFFAIQQMMSKGKINAEEFRLQLAERMPIALLAATRATGTTAAQFTELLESGKLISAEVLPKMAAELRKLSAASLDVSKNSLNASIGRLGNTLFAFMQSITKGGFSSGLKDLIDTIVKAEPALIRLGGAIGTVAGWVLHFLARVADLVVWLDKVTGGISTVAIAFGVIRAAITLTTGAVMSLGSVFGLSMGGAAASASAAAGAVGSSLGGMSSLMASVGSIFSASGAAIAAGLAIVGAAAYSAFAAISDQQTKFMGETISMGEIVSYKLEQLGQWFGELGTSFTKFVTNAIIDLGGFKDETDLKTVLMGLTWTDFFNTMMGGWAAIGSAVTDILDYVARQVGYSLGVIKLGFKGFVNDIYQMAGKDGPFDLTSDLPQQQEDLNTFFDNMKKKAKEVSNFDFAAGSASAIKKGLGVTDADLEAIAQEKIRRRLNDAIRLQDEKALAAALEEQRKASANGAVAISEEEARKLKRIRDREAKEALKAAKEAHEKMLETLKSSDAIGDQWKAAMIMMEDEAKKSTGQLANFFVDAFSKAEDSLAEFVTTGKFSISDFTSWAAKELAKIAIGNIGRQILGVASSGGTGSFLSALFMHSGGVVGASGNSTINVSPSVFANAPRFHNGLKPDEFPAILQKGETVIPKNQSASQFLGDASISIPVNVSVTVNGGGAGSGDADNAKILGNTVAEAVRSEFYAMLDKEQRSGGRLAKTRGMI